MSSSDRLQKLHEMLQRSPDDTFLLYGIALEHKKLNQPQQAVEYLRRVLELDPEYLYAYHQLGLVFESLGETESARRVYREGIEAASSKGDAHAKEEIAAALALID